MFCRSLSLIPSNTSYSEPHWVWTPQQTTQIKHPLLSNSSGSNSLLSSLLLFLIFALPVFSVRHCTQGIPVSALCYFPALPDTYKGLSPYFMIVIWFLSSTYYAYLSNYHSWSYEILSLKKKALGFIFS